MQKHMYSTGIQVSRPLRSSAVLDTSILENVSEMSFDYLSVISIGHPDVDYEMMNAIEAQIGESL